MVSKMDNNAVPMVVIPTQNVVRQQELASDPAAKHTSETVFLENREEIKPRGSFEKGIFIDLYI